LFVVSCLSALRAGRNLPFELLFLILLLPFVLIGSFAPSPAFDQYFFPLVPLVLLVGLFAFGSMPRENVWFRRLTFCGLAAVLVSAGMGWRGFNDIEDYFKPVKW